MISLSEYYEESLYPLQDGVLRSINQSGTDFFLTGGTALSQGYYKHRYSDDLDFFVNPSTTYDEQLDVIFENLKEAGFHWNPEIDYIVFLLRKYRGEGKSRQHKLPTPSLQSLRLFRYPTANKKLYCE
jgi:predicted nucleotidyltransferase component of viral defense system